MADPRPPFPPYPHWSAQLSEAAVACQQARWHVELDTPDGWVEITCSVADLAVDVTDVTLHLQGPARLPFVLGRGLRVTFPWAGQVERYVYRQVSLEYRALGWVSRVQGRRLNPFRFGDTRNGAPWDAAGVAITTTLTEYWYGRR